MTVRASSFPSVRLENMKQQRYERSQQNQDKLIAVLQAENEERMLKILLSYIANWDIQKYIDRQNKQKEFMARRIRTVLSCNNDKWETN